ncbi:MAG: hypothetical protein LIP15_05550, partial [Clostridium sp.]|nr:hypothetical protein [Clostridium sp.]
PAFVSLLPLEPASINFTPSYRSTDVICSASVDSAYCRSMDVFRKDFFFANVTKVIKCFVFIKKVLLTPGFYLAVRFSL